MDYGGKLAPKSKASKLRMESRTLSGIAMELKTVRRILHRIFLYIGP